MRASTASLACLALLASCAADPDPPCPLTQPVAVYDMPPGPGPLLAPVTVDGRDLAFTLDTGAETSFIDSSLADRMNLLDIGDRERRSGRFVNEGAAGSFTTYPAAVRHLQFANGDMTFGAFQVGDMPRPRGGQPDSDGLLGVDILSNWAFEIDRPDSRLRFFDEDKCTVTHPPWSGPTIAVALTPLPSGGYSPLVRFPVTVEGHDVTAELDTGAPGLAINGETAAGLGIDGNAGQTVEIGGVGNLRSRGHLHHFDHVTIAGHDFGPVTMAILPDMNNPEMLVGRSFLLNHPILVSYRQHRIFIGLPTAPAS